MGHLVVDILIKAMAFLFLACFITSFVFYLIYEKNIFDKWVEVCISLSIGVFFAMVYYYSYQRKDVVTPMLLLVLPVVFIVFYYTPYDTNMLSPITFGVVSAVKNDWKYNFNNINNAALS